ncbi:MAG: hypothetical protein IJU63_08325 [Bacteroidales bacterium]|nr:hypothetical protein [Bacteroidales bacterium]MCR5277655.1 hypothetical protein [Bacteroidales bacterium]
MTFKQIPGNESVVRALAGMVDAGRVPHAILFHEDDGGGGIALCLAFLQYLFCEDRHDGDACGVCPTCNRIAKLIHPDVHFIYPVSGGSRIAASEKPTSLSYIKYWRELVLSNPGFTEADLNAALGIEGKSALIAVGEAKELLDSLSLSALEGGYRAVVIYLPERMNQEAANRLLKVIEEPPELTQFLLVTHAPERVLPTIASRCQRLRILPAGFAPAADSVVTEENARFAGLFGDLMDALLRRSVSRSLEVAEQLAALPSRESAKAFCKFAGERLREVFLLQQGLPQLAAGADERTQSWAAQAKRTFPRTAMAALDRAHQLIERNVNPKILFTDLVDRMFLSL